MPEEHRRPCAMVKTDSWYRSEMQRLLPTGYCVFSPIRRLQSGCVVRPDATRSAIPPRKWRRECSKSMLKHANYRHRLACPNRRPCLMGRIGKRKRLSTKTPLKRISPCPKDISILVCFYKRESTC